MKFLNIYLFIINVSILGSILYIPKMSIGQEEWEKLIPNNIFDTIPKQLVIIGNDRSGSNIRIKKLSLEDYGRLFSRLSENGGAYVQILLIGNPKPLSYSPITLLIKCKLHHIIPPPDCKENKILSCLLKVKNINDNIDKYNIRAENHNRRELSAKLSLIKSNIIEYSSLNNYDLTDLDDVLKRINITLLDAKKDVYSKESIILITDGWNEPKRNGRKPLEIKIDNSDPNIRFILVGWENETNDCKYILSRSTTRRFLSIDDLFNNSNLFKN